MIISYANTMYLKSAVLSVIIVFPPYIFEVTLSAAHFRTQTARSEVFVLFIAQSEGFINFLAKL